MVPSSGAASSGFDHVIIGVGDLDRTADLWRRVGFTITPRGRHIGWGTANYCIMFDRDYVELLGILDPSQYVHGLDRFLADHGDGLLGVAFGTSDPQETFRALQSIDQAGDPPKDLARYLDLPDGTVEPRFQLTHPREAKAFGITAFFCKHLTPELVRQPAWLSHPNDAIGIGAIDLRVPDPTGLASRYAAMFGPASVTQDDGALRVQAGTTRLMFRRGPDGVDGMTFAVGDRSKAADWCAQEGLATPGAAEDDALSLVVPVNGIKLAFASR